jgi:hypothetical protein
MGQFIMGNSKMIKNMERENIHILMEKYMKVIGKIIYQMDREFLNFLQVKLIIMKEIGEMGNVLVLEK